MTMLDAVKNGATFVPADVRPGDLYWKLIRADGPEWWDGKHSIFVDVWDEYGFRMENVPVVQQVGGRLQMTPSKLGKGDFALDFPMFNQRPAVDVWVEDGKHVSDRLNGMGLVPFEDHVAYKLIFQLTRAEADAPTLPPPPTPPGKKSAVRLYLDDGNVEVYVKNELVYPN